MRKRRSITEKVSDKRNCSLIKENEDTTNVNNLQRKARVSIHKTQNLLSQLKFKKEIKNTKCP